MKTLLLSDNAAAEFLRALSDAFDTQPAPSTSAVPDAPPARKPMPTGAYPTGDELKHILASLSFEFNQNNAKQNSMVGDPGADLAVLCGLSPNAATMNSEYSGFINGAANANPLTTAAKWLHLGKSQEQTLAFLNGSNLPISEADMASLATVMRYYNLA